MADDSGVWKGQSRARWSAGLLASGEGVRWQWTPVRRGSREARLGSRLRHRRHRQWATLEAAAPVKLGSIAVRLCADGGTGGNVLCDGGARACGGVGQA